MRNFDADLWLPVIIILLFGLMWFLIGFEFGKGGVIWNG